MSSRDFDNNYEIGFINGIQFGVYSPDIILKKSVVQINVDTLYDSNGDPRINGLFDPRMGYIEPHLKCKTCDQTYINCPGHFGHIELPKPVFNLQFEEYIVKILRCVCIKCSRLLLNKNHQIIKNIVASTKGNYKDRFDKIFKLAQKIKTCGLVEKKTGDLYDNGGCGAIQPSKYNSGKLRTDYLISAEWKYDNGDNPINLVEDLNAEIVLAIFKRITVDDCLAMGFSPKWCMPSWLIITVLPVVPPSVRPSVRQYNSQRSEDDLTNKYYEIIKSCQILRDKLSKNVNLSPDIIKQWNNVVQHNVITLFNNEIKGIPPALTRGCRPMKTLRQRLSGKEGRIRNNLMGKRVDFSARSVISPDANLSIEELGVPEKIAMNLTFPEVVNKYNINRLYQLVRNGNKIYPGAKSIKSVKDNRPRMILNDQDTSKIILNYGDVVNRHLINGDTVLFNRQPSLHKMSMMAHKVRVMKGNTFRLNVDVCKPYNADFDGDEMNMHVPQSIQTAVELKYLAAVSKHIISPSTNEPIIGPAQDNLLGLFKITDDNVFFSHQEIMNLMVGVDKFSGVLPEPSVVNGKIVKWTGKQIYSMILPPITYYNKLSKNPNLKDVIIENGILKQGQIEKKSSVAILHYIFNDYGHREATRYLNDLQKIVSRYIIRSGFSVGMSDLIVNKEIRKRNEDVIVQGKKDVVELTKKVHLNILENITDGLDILYENKVKAINSKVASTIKDSVTKALPLSNRINYIVTSGSKGSELNIQQMMCLVGQQDIDQKRVPMGFTDRTLPHYPRYENGAESRGFISSNFLNGLNPQEFFFHAMSGREGVIDTAVKTANSGYLQRKLVKSMEDLKVAHDFSVRGSNNDIVQFCYGYDGFNSTDLEKQTTNFIKIDIDKLNMNYYIDPNDKFEYVLKSEIDKMKKIDNWKTIITNYNKNIERVIEEFHTIYTKFSRIEDIKIFYPVKFERLILNTTKQFNLDNVNKSDIHPIEIIEEINELIKQCSVSGNRSLACEVLVWDYLSPKVLLRDKKFNRVAFLHVINAIKTRYKYSLAEGGDMVGPLAAQSLGEKTSQATLHSVDWETEIIIAKNGELLLPKIGEFIDNYYEECLADLVRKDKIQYIECANGEMQIYIPLDDGNDWRAYSCDENGNVMWTKLEAITRHPVINEDNTETILEVELECGRIVKATKGKSFLVYDEDTNKIIDKNGSELNENDMIPICEGLELDTNYFNNITHLDTKQYLNNNVTNLTNLTNPIIPELIPLTKQFGYSIGVYLAKGITSDITCESQIIVELINKVFGNTIDNKIIPVWILQTPHEFMKGIITGYFNNNVIDNININDIVNYGGSIFTSSKSKDLLDMIGLMLNRFNISWSIYKTKKYNNLYTITILESHNDNFINNFEIENANATILTNKNSNIRNVKLQNVLMSKVKKIVEVLPTEKTYSDGNKRKRFVYDLTVEKTRNFVSKSLLNLKDTFHFSGVGEKSSVTAGVPRLNELLSNTKNPKNNSCEIYLDSEHRFNRDYALKVANNIELTTIGDVLASTAIYLEPNNEYNNVLPEDREFLEIYRVFSEMDPQASQIPSNPWLIRLEFDRRKIIDKKITMEDINLILKTNYPQASIMFMDDNASKLVFRMRLTFQSNPNRANDDIMFLEDKIKEISDVIIKGVDNITKVYLITNEQTMEQIIVKENGSFVAKKEFTISTDGSNLFDIIVRKGVDSTRTYSIDPNEIYSIFGIEAARFQIQKQLNQVLIGINIDLSPRHLDLLCDKMCQNGEIMSVSRHGIKKENIGPLAKASFEETTDQLLEASLFGAFDNIKGVSSNIMVGQIPTCGTGDSTVLLDEDLLNTQEDVIEEDENVDINKYFKTSEYCEAAEIKFSLSDIKQNDGEYDDYMDVLVE
jgi:DNA-directed RNA polymerase beta' subunit